MLHGALQQFMKDVTWGELDFLVMDLPPGTGDVALTLSQKVKVTGAVMVTTPQAVATDDVFKSVSMCTQGQHPHPGRRREHELVRRLSAGVRHELFGKGGGQAVADFAEAPLLGQVPLDPERARVGRQGHPGRAGRAAGARPAKAFVAIAERVVELCEAAHEGDDAAPTIDRSGGTGKKRLPVAK